MADIITMDLEKGSSMITRDMNRLIIPLQKLKKKHQMANLMKNSRIHNFIKIFIMNKAPTVMEYSNNLLLILIKL